MTYDDLLAVYRTQQEAADAIAVSKQAISLWKKKGIPIKFQISFEVASQGRLRADLPEAVRGAA